ncbi:MAG: hypothetical protein QM619_09195 [Micropruina sp.]|uniref:hypothetical protein n=1 Tax=Micropruina sp. TaxID=2737536 RepID=UPI0039E4E3BF
MRLLLSSLLICLIPVAGCTIGGSSPTSPGPAASTAADPTGAPSASVTSAQPSPSASELPVLASRKTTLAQLPAVVSLNELSVRDGVTTLTWTVANAQPAGSKGIGIQMSANTFGDGIIARVPGTDDPVENDQYYVDGVFLLDAVNKLRYLPARDSQGVCVCSYAPSSLFIAPGGSMPFSATFKGLPEGVTTVDVSIPRVGTFTRVPVQR